MEELENELQQAPWVALLALLAHHIVRLMEVVREPGCFVSTHDHAAGNHVFGRESELEVVEIVCGKKVVPVH